MRISTNWPYKHWRVFIELYRVMGCEYDPMTGGVVFREPDRLRSEPTTDMWKLIAKTEFPFQDVPCKWYEA